jgi:hypothetical protein
MRKNPLLALLFVLSFGAGCPAQSRLWRLSPFSGLDEESRDRLNLWPLAFSAGGGTSILWPLVDFDANGFAVRPLVSHDKHDWDFLWPLSHFDAEYGEGWALTFYRLGDNVGLAPVFNFGPTFNYVLPAWWEKEGGRVTHYGLFPIFGAQDDFGYAGLAWWNREEGHGGFGLFPLFTVSSGLNWYGPLWWNAADGESAPSAGLFPLVWKWGDPTQILVFPLYYGDAERQVVFPFYYGDETRRFVFPAWYSDETRRALLPFYYGEHDPDRDLHVSLVPPTYWETRAGRENHFVLPFYGHVAREGFDLTAWFPLYATRSTPAGWHWFSPIGDGWSEGSRSGLDLYPLWYSARSGDTSREMLLPFYYYRQRDDDRLLLTPLGGRGWNASGRSRFVNVLGPVYHHSIGSDTETVAVAWPFYEAERIGEKTKITSIPFFGSTRTPSGRDTWFLAGLGRSVEKDDSSSFRLFPLVATSDAKESPDLLFDFTLAGASSNGASWSRHLLPLFWESGDARQGRSDAWTLAGLGRSVEEPGASSLRLFPLYSQSSAAEPPDPLFDWTLVGLHSNEGAWSGHVFPLYWGRGDGDTTTHTGPLGLARVATTEHGSAWRLWPLASWSSDPAADGVVDELSLFRHERTDTGTRDWLFPLYYSSRRGDEADVGVLSPLFRRQTTASGSSLRLWPLFSTSDAAGLDDWFDPFTLFGTHTTPEKDHVHVGTDAIFGFDRCGEGKRSWNARLFTFCDFGHDERTRETAQPDLEEQRIANANGDGAAHRKAVTVERDHAGFLFDWFLVEKSATLDDDGGRRDESHYRLPLLHEYRGTPEKREWDLLCYAVHSTETRDEGSFSVLGYGYRRERKGETISRDIFPFVTWDTAPQSKHVSFLWHLFDYDRQGDRRSGHVLFIPWGKAD